MTRVQQTFTNELPEDLVVFVEMECWVLVAQARREVDGGL